MGTARLKHYLARRVGKKGCCEATWGQLQLQRNSFPSGVSSTRRQWFSNLAAQKIPGVQAPIHTNYSRIPRGGSRHQYLLKLSTLTQCTAASENQCCKAFPKLLLTEDRAGDTSSPLLPYCLHQGSTNFACKRPDSKYFWLCRTFC